MAPIGGVRSAVLASGSAIPNSGLVHRWSIDSGSGNATDSEGSNDLTDQGYSWTNNSKYYNDYALDFPGNGEYAGLNQIPTVSKTSDFSVVFGVEIRDTSAHRVIFHHNQSSSDRIAIEYNNGTDGLLQAAVYDGSSFVLEQNYDISSGGLGRVGDRILVGIDWDASTDSGNFRLDGDATANSGSGAATSGNTGQAVGFSAAQSNYSSHDGTVDFGVVYNRQLTDAEWSDIFSAWS